MLVILLVMAIVLRDVIEMAIVIIVPLKRSRLRTIGTAPVVIVTVVIATVVIGGVGL